MKKTLFVISLAALMAGCASGSADKDAQITRDWTVEKLYSEASDEMNSGNYTRAIKLYDILGSRFPFGRYAQQAELDTAYTHYRDGEPELALATLDRFERNHPAHPNLDYVLYLKGLVLFNEDQSFLNKLAAQDWSERDPKANRDAFRVFQELTERYPNSRYTPDAVERMTKLLDALGGHEIGVARYYMKRGAYLAASNRAQVLIQEFNNTPYVEEALAILVAAYGQMNQTQLRDDAYRVLQLNYPQSEYLKTPWKVIEAPWWRYWK
ncbi:MAG: outer membrane protein assembly factor BamD [Neisseriaceae bacterium]|nr:outer membrane protein assembly factor BamD [Neisseriaceae bacterium]MBP6862696.1 outer membrane protein assembly factor BamD [Neisseriaceae bacterium]